MFLTGKLPEQKPMCAQEEGQTRENSNRYFPFFCPLSHIFVNCVARNVYQTFFSDLKGRTVEDVHFDISIARNKGLDQPGLVPLRAAVLQCSL